MMIDTRLATSGAKPFQTDLTDLDGPIEPHLGRPDVPTKIVGVLGKVEHVTRVADMRDPCHERCELFDVNGVAEPCHHVGEILARLPAHPRHEQDEHALPLGYGSCSWKAWIR